MHQRAVDLPADAVLCDMDGTLVDSTAAVEGVWRHVARDHGLDADAVLAYAHGRQPADTIARFLPESSADTRDRLAGWLVEEEVRRLDGVVEVPGARGFLVALAHAGVPVALVTSATEALARARMGAAGLECPRVMVTAESVARGKPDPEGYLQAASRLGVEIARCVVFEDAPAGLEAGLRSGARIVAVGGRDADRAPGAPRVADLRAVVIRRSDDGSFLSLTGAADGGRA